MVITCQISDRAFEAMVKVASAWGQDVDYYISKKFRDYEDMVKDPDKLESRLSSIESIIGRDRLREYYKKHKWQEYRLKTVSKNEYIKIGWRLAPIPDFGIKHLETELKENVGKYYYKVSRVSTAFGGFNSVMDVKFTFRSSLRMLKKAINKELDKHGYRAMYKVRERSKR